MIPINNFKFVSEKRGGEGVEHHLDSEFASSNCMARNNFQVWGAKKLWDTFLGVGSAHRASR